MIRKTIILSLLAAHLLIVLLRSALVDGNKIPHAIKPSIYLYCSCVGAMGYDFFALSTTTQPVVKCYVLDSDNVMRTEILGGGNSTYEYKSGIITQYTYQTPELAARLAANYCFTLHPHASVVTISIGDYIPPNMNRNQTNQEGSFSEFYHASYIHE